MKGKLRRFIGGVFSALVLVMTLALPVAAGTTADVTVYALPEYISISVAPTSWNVSGGAALAVSTNYSTAVDYFTITNGSTVTTNLTISVTTSNWNSAGTNWTHSDTATPGASTAALLANVEGGAWDTDDIIIKYAAVLNKLKEDLAAATNQKFGLMLRTPTSYPDGQQNNIVVRVTAYVGA